jgi:hypothetical protein
MIVHSRKLFCTIKSKPIFYFLHNYFLNSHDGQRNDAFCKMHLLIPNQEKKSLTKRNLYCSRIDNKKKSKV